MGGISFSMESYGSYTLHMHTVCVIVCMHIFVHQSMVIQVYES